MMLELLNPVPITVSITAAAPAGTEAGEIDVAANGIVTGVPLFEAGEFAEPQPAILTMVESPRMAEKMEPSEKCFM